MTIRAIICRKLYNFKSKYHKSIENTHTTRSPASRTLFVQAFFGSRRDGLSLAWPMYQRTDATWEQHPSTLAPTWQVQYQLWTPSLPNFPSAVLIQMRCLVLFRNLDPKMTRKRVLSDLC